MYKTIRHGRVSVVYFRGIISNLGVLSYFMQGAALGDGGSAIGAGQLRTTGQNDG